MPRSAWENDSWQRLDSILFFRVSRGSSDCCNGSDGAQLGILDFMEAALKIRVAALRQLLGELLRGLVGLGQHKNTIAGVGRRHVRVLVQGEAPWLELS